MQDILIDVSAGVVVMLIFFVVGWFGYEQIMQYLDRRKIQRMVGRELVHVRQEELQEWLRERGVGEE